MNKPSNTFFESEITEIDKSDFKKFIDKQGILMKYGLQILMRFVDISTLRRSMSVYMMKEATKSLLENHKLN